jgi:uncharacterized lipoprotein YajG
MRRVLSLFVVTLLSACGTTEYAMPYAPTVAVVPAQPPGPVARVAEVRTTRRAGREDPRWLGTIRGGYGNPLKALAANRPVDEVVRQAVNDALAARGWLAGESAPVEVLVNIVQFDANRYVRMEATSALEVTLRDRATGSVLWQGSERVYNVQGSLLAVDTGVFASPDALHALMLRTMNESIDRLLAQPGFVAALGRARPRA